MERESLISGKKLVDIASIDYPEASEILVSFPEHWEFIAHLRQEERPLYIAALPPQQERPRRDRFYGLPVEINETLTTYRLYKLFQPWTVPIMAVRWDAISKTGRVEDMSDLKVQLRPIGQAQIWKGTTYGMLWECYSFGVRRTNWQEILVAIWQAVEQDMAVDSIFTEPYEPTLEEDYTQFLSDLGYAPYSASPRWWSKSFGQRPTKACWFSRDTYLLLHSPTFIVPFRNLKSIK